MSTLPTTAFDTVKPFHPYDRSYVPEIPTPNDKLQLDDKKYITEQAYWDKYYQQSDTDTIYEWNNGLLEEKGMSSCQTYEMSVWFTRILYHYLDCHPENKMYDLNFGFRLNLGYKNAVRIPDVGIVSQHNPIQMQPHDKRYQGTYDICIEVVSDSNQDQIDRDVIYKKREYALAGVQEYYTIHEESRYIQFYQLQGRHYIPIPRQNGIIKSNVLLGFQFRIADLYQQPSEDEMIDDPVYKNYVALSRQKDKQRADKNAEIANEERRLKEIAIQKVEKERQKADEKLKQTVLRAFKMIGNNLETIAIISDIKKERVESILKQARKL